MANNLEAANKRIAELEAEHEDIIKRYEDWRADQIDRVEALERTIREAPCPQPFSYAQSDMGDTMISVRKGQRIKPGFGLLVDGGMCDDCNCWKREILKQ